MLLQTLRYIPKRTWDVEEHRWYFKPEMYDDVFEALIKHKCCFDTCATKEEVQRMRIICEDFDGEEFGFNFPYDQETADHFRRAGGKFEIKSTNKSKLWYVGKKNGHKLVDWLKKNGYIIIDKFNFD